MTKSTKIKLATKRADRYLLLQLIPTGTTIYKENNIKEQLIPYEYIYLQNTQKQLTFYNLPQEMQEWENIGNSSKEHEANSKQQI